MNALADRANPVLLHGGRRSMRASLFTVCFLIALAIAVFATILPLLSIGFSRLGLFENWTWSELPPLEELVPAQDGRLGTSLFMFLLYALSLAVHGLVPLQAFFALGEEREEATQDLLNLASIRPGAIVRGKLFSILAQTALYYSAFTPFMAACFLLRGVALEGVILALSSSMLLALALTSSALLISSLPMPKLLRIGALILFGFFAYGLALYQNFGSTQILMDPSGLSEPVVRVVIGISAAVALFLTITSLVLAPVSMLHPEENGSTGPRLMASLLVVLIMIGIAALERTVPDRETVLVAGFVAMWLLMLMIAVFVTEPERLGRRAARKVPRSTALALLVSPWLPGGGRGVLFALLHLGALLLFLSRRALVDRFSGTPAPFSGPLLKDEVEVWLMLGTYLVTILLFTPAIFAPWTRRPVIRVLSLLSIPLVVLLAFIAVTSIRAALSIHPTEMHVANPILPLAHAFGGWFGEASIQSHLAILSLGTAAVLLLNTWRVLRGLAEVVSASSARRHAAPAVVWDEASEGASA